MCAFSNHFRPPAYSVNATSAVLNCRFANGIPRCSRPCVSGSDPVSRLCPADAAFSLCGCPSRAFAAIEHSCETRITNASNKKPSLRNEGRTTRATALCVNVVIIFASRVCPPHAGRKSNVERTRARRLLSSTSPSHEVHWRLELGLSVRRVHVQIPGITSGLRKSYGAFPALPLSTRHEFYILAPAIDLSC